MSERLPHSHGEHPPQLERAVSHEPEPRQLNPRIYVTRGLPLRTELTAGLWLDMARSPRDIEAEMYSALTDEEHAGNPLYIWDYRDYGAFDVTTGAIGLEGVDSIDTLSEIAIGIKEYGPAFAAWAKYNDDDRQPLYHFARAYKGHYESAAAFIREQLRPMAYEAILDRAMPQEIRPFVAVDYQAVAAQLEADGVIVPLPAENGVWIFSIQA